MIDGLHPPTCEAPSCERPGFMYVGTRIYCGEHVIKVMAINERRQQEEIDKALANDTE